MEGKAIEEKSIENNSEKALCISDETKEKINEYMKEKFLDRFSKEELEEEEKFIEKLGDNIKYQVPLLNNGYGFTIKGLNYFDEINYSIIYVSNLLAIPIKQKNFITANDEVKASIEIKGLLAPDLEELPNIIVPLEAIENGNWTLNPQWSFKVKFGIPAQKNRQVFCLKSMSEFMKKEDIYQHLGFIKINGKRVFLHIGGALGTDESVKVDLDDDVLNQYKFTEKEFDLKDTFKYSLNCIDVAPKRITVPLLGLVFMSPLTSIFEELKIPLGFLTWVVGPQQSKKTSLVSAFCCHFGNFNKNNAPMSFLDGIPSAKEKSAKLADVLTLCDDYFPSSNKIEASEMKKFTEKLISLCSDKMVGARSKSNGEMRKTYRSKNQIVATGEIFPDLSQSRMSRVLFINIEKNSVDGEKLKDVQNHREELQNNMKKYITYIIENIDEVKEKIATIFEERVKIASDVVTYRTAEMIAGVFVGISLLFEFAQTNKLVSKNDKEKRLNEYWDILVEVAKEQNIAVENIDPTQMLLTAIESLTNTEQLTCFDIESAKYVKQSELVKNGFVRIL